MRLVIGSIAVACWACINTAAIAQTASTSITGAHKDVGEVQAQILKYDQAVGVVSQLTRSQSASVECNGVCYFPSSNRPIAWRCDPGRRCDLRCTVNPPAGACN